MNRNQKIIGGIVVFILVFFGAKNYLQLEKENAKNNNSEINNNKNIETNSTNNPNSESNQNDIENKSDIEKFETEKKIFTYSSEFYDIEKQDGSVNTKREVTYHTFDFNKRIVTQNSILNGKRVIMSFPFYEMYEENGLAATTYVLKVNTLGLKEIWWSPNVPNLGYDYEDGTRIACYDLKVQIEK